MSELEEIVVRAQSGDPDAYDLIYDRFKDMAFSYAYSILGHYELAEDARQDAFYDAYCDLLALRNPATFPGWFKQIVFRRSLRLRRNNRILDVPIDEAPAAALAHYDTPGTRLRSKEIRESVRKAIEALPPNEREVTRLYYIREHSLKTIGRLVELPEKTVKSRLYMARARLRYRLMDLAKESVRRQRRTGDPRFQEAATVEAIAQFDSEIQSLSRPGREQADRRMTELLCAKGRMLRFLGRTGEAIAAFTGGMASPGFRHNADLRARLRTEIGLTQVQTGDYRTAQESFLAAKATAKRLGGGSPLLSAALNGMGMCAWGLGDFSAARRYYAESLAACRGKGFGVQKADAENNLALLDWKAGRLKEALRHLKNSLKHWKKLKSRYERALVTMNIGIVEENLGRCTLAKRHYKEALALAKEVNNLQAQSATYGNLANLALTEHRWQRALELSARALELARSAKDRRSEAIALENLALSHSGLGQPDKSHAAIRNARKIARLIGDQERELSLTLAEIETWIKERRFEGAFELIKQARKTVDRKGYAAELPRLLRLKAHAEWLAGSEAKARETLKTAVQECRKRNLRPEEQKVLALARSIGWKP